jgi:hypothetical protein
MPTGTVVERWPKSFYTGLQIEAERALRLDAGALSSEISEDATAWTLTTVYDSGVDGEGDVEESEVEESEKAGSVGAAHSGDDEPY